MVQDGPPPKRARRTTVLTGANRATILGWLRELRRERGCGYDVVHLAVNLLDRFLERDPQPLDRLQLAAMTAFWVAEKWEVDEALGLREDDLWYSYAHNYWHLQSKHCVDYCADAYTERLVLAFELHFLRTLDWVVVPLRADPAPRKCAKV